VSRADAHDMGGTMHGNAIDAGRREAEKGVIDFSDFA
jgi:hypothetical protein